MDTNNYSLLTYHLIDCQDLNQIQNLLLMLKSIVKTSHNSLISYMKSSEIYITLHTLLASDDISTVKSTLSVIFCMKEADLLTSFTLNEMMFLYQFQMINSKISPDLANTMIDLIKDGFTELFPVCCCYLLRLDSISKKTNFFLNIFDSIQPSEKIITNIIWVFWAVYGAIVQNEKKVFSFLIRCKKSAINYLYALIDRICQVCDFDVNYWKKEFLSIIVDDIISLDPNEYSPQNENKNDDIFLYIKNFLSLSSNFIFFRHYQNYYNPSLLKLYNNFCLEINEIPDKYKNIEPYTIPYSDSNIFIEIVDFLDQNLYLLPSKKQEKYSSAFEVFNKVVNSCFVEEKFVFGMRFNEDGVWIDYDFAIEILQIISKFSIKSHEKLMNVIGAILNNNLILCDLMPEKLYEPYLFKCQNDMLNSFRKFAEEFLEKSRKIFNNTLDLLKEYGRNKSNEIEQKINDNYIKTEKNYKFLIKNDEDINETYQEKENDEDGNIEINSNKSLEQIVLPLIDSEEIKKIQKIQVIGHGSQSNIYKVIYNEKIMAMKELRVLDTKSAFFVKFKNFFKEFEIVNTIHHPNIIKSKYFFTGDEINLPFILFELLPYNLKKVIKELTDVERITIIFEISLALNEMHRLKIIHRDLKPENILLDEKKHVKVSDFGFSCLHDVESQSESLTTGIGTLKFMAPELLNENKHYNEKVDVYSFGVVVFFILTNGEYPSISVGDAASGKKAPIPNIVNTISNELINWCWSLSADERPSFSQIIDYIKENEFNLIDGIQEKISKINHFLSI